MCYLSKLSTTSHFVPLFLAHGDVVVGFAIFHIAYSTKKKKRKKKERKRHSSMVCKCWWAPNGIGEPWFEKGKKVGRSAKFYKNSTKSANLSLKNLLHFCMEDSKNPIASR
jgi:hypothetical protein